jgi:predicted esterase
MSQEASSESVSEFQASAGYERFRRTWVQVSAKSDRAGERIEIREGDRVLGEARLARDAEGCGGRIEFQMPPVGESFGALDLWADGRKAGPVDVPDAEAERAKAFDSEEVHFAPYVFDGPEFPPCDFAHPSLVEDLIGRYAIRADFYDKDFQPVSSAESAGRYGAAVEIEAADGRIFRRYRTLFRKPDSGRPRYRKPSPPENRMSQPMPRWYGKAEPIPLEIPDDLGIDPAVVREQSTTIYEYLRGRWEYAIWDDPWTPVLLAGLFETQPGDGDIRRNNAWERDRRWWTELKRRRGELRTPYLLYLPQGYEEDSEKLWPLVLFLHGSGEIGDDLDMVRRCGLPKLAEEGQSFPFILVAPQSQREEWFWLAATQEALLDEVCANHRVDPDRVYVTGFSMGGRGAWMQALENPDRYAAIAPICGSIPEPEETKRIRRIPVWAFVGEEDGDQTIRRMVEAHQSYGGDAKLTVYPNTGHDAWTPTYANPEFYEWLLGQRRGREWTFMGRTISEDEPSGDAKGIDLLGRG